MNVILTMAGVTVTYHVKIQMEAFIVLHVLLVILETVQMHLVLVSE